MAASLPALHRTKSALRVCLPGKVEVCFALDGTRVLGIRDVTCDGVPLRSPQKLWRPLIRTPDGIQYHEFRLRAARVVKGAVRVETDAIGFRSLLAEDTDEYLCDVFSVSASDAQVCDRFTWELRPSTCDVAGHVFAGFSYVYRFASTGGRKIHGLLDAGSWEIGGDITGNTLLFQGEVNPPAVTFKARDFYTTACNYYGAELKGVMSKPDRVSIQLLPRLATIQAFDFLAHRQGLLFNYFDPIEDVLSLLQKNEDERILHVIDGLRWPLAATAESRPKHVLFLPTAKPLTREDSRNLWLRAYDLVHERERERYGIAHSHVTPNVWTPQFSQDTFSIGADSGPRDRAIYYLADKILDRWADSGVREVTFPSLWTCDYTVDRFTCKNDTGLQGGLTVSGICCVRVHEIDALWGGPRAVAYFVKKAHTLGLKVRLWWATHLSRRAPIFREHPEFMVKSRDGKGGCGGIGPDCIIPMDLNNPECFAWEYGQLKAVFEATGIDGFFHDSYGNYTFLPTHYGDPLRRGQQDAYARLLVRLQKLGLNTISVEGLGPWGAGHFGMNLVKADQKVATRGRYQNALEWWLGHEDMLYGLDVGIGARLWDDEIAAREFAFRSIAGGGRFGFTQYENGVEMWSGWLRDLNRLHARLLPLDGARTLLPGGRGVLWLRGDGSQLLFAFKDFNWPVPADTKVLHVTGDAESAVPLANGRLAAAPLSVYRLIP